MLPLLLAALSASQGVDADALRDLLETARKKHDVPALAAAVVTTKGVTAKAAVGVRKRGEAVKATADDVWHLGSDTKAVTATLIAVLVAEGKLKYDATLPALFPALTDSIHDDYRKVTLEQLLTHRAGLPANFAGGTPSAAGIVAQRQKAAMAVLSRKPATPPGTKLVYSNVGYTLAGHAAEIACGASWEALTKRHVAGPLGMTTFGVGAPGDPEKLDQPRPHEDDGTPVEIAGMSDNVPLIGPAGRGHASLDDWGRFVAEVMRGVATNKAGLLPGGAYKRLATPVPDDALPYTPGGWGVPKASRLVLTHDGSNTMNYATALLFPAEGVAVLVCCNQGGDAGKKATHAVRDEVAKRLLAKKK